MKTPQVAAMAGMTPLGLKQTIWNSDGTDGPCLICAPPEREKPKPAPVAHTPGPWGIPGPSPDLIGTEGPPRRLIASTHGDNFEANARLIAAAPELLGAVEKLLKATAHPILGNLIPDARIDAILAVCLARDGSWKGEGGGVSYGIVTAIKEIERRNRRREPTLIDAAKAVVALSGWMDVTPTRRVFQSSAMAVDVLRKAIEREENPVLKLAPEPIPSGL